MRAGKGFVNTTIMKELKIKKCDRSDKRAT